MIQERQNLLGHLFRLGDLLILCGAAWVSRHLGGALVSHPPFPEDSGAIWGGFFFLSAAWLFVSWRRDLYVSRRTENLLHEISALAEVLLFSLGVAVFASYLFLGGLPFEPLATLLVAFGVFGLERMVLRTSLRFLRAKGFNYRYVLMVGEGRAAEILVRNFHSNPSFGIRVLGSITFGGEGGKRLQSLRHFGSIQRLKSVLSNYVVDTVLLAPSEMASVHEINQVLQLCDEAGIPCNYAPGFFSLQNLLPEVVWYGNVPAFSFHTKAGASASFAIKRMIDVLVSGALIILLSPVLILFAFLVWLHDRGPILFKQPRSGLHGKVFQCLKFRSMCLDAEDKLKELAKENEQDGPVFKIKKDPRITPIGRFLRKFSLDELPQLFNVLKGDMSLVGPRPPLPSEVVQYDWWQRRRLSVRPGITCIWQVWGRNRVSFQRWVEMDLYYIDNWSLWMDFKLLLRTVQVVFRGTGM
ncbi:MAG TPA: sugar transferase [Planctomycetes bacterium]|nr:sugar transferase [Planctomycetota bacterium]